MIDDHIVGIEKPWYETEQSEDAVSYNGAFISEVIALNKARKRKRSTRNASRFSILFCTE